MIASARWLVVAAACIVGSVARADHYDEREVQPPTKAAAARRCVAEARRLSAKPVRSAGELLRLYDAEICIGKFGLWAGSASDAEFERFQAEYPVDDEIKAARVETREYLRSNRARFRQVSDGWKDESPLLEPNDHWLLDLRRRFPDSDERWKIEWDQAWKALARQFSFSPDDRGKSCQQAYDEIIAQDPKAFHEEYSDEEIAARITDCETQRARCRAELDKLDRRFSKRPVRKRRAFDIDPAEVVSNLYFGLC